MTQPMGLLLVLGGLFAIVCAVMDFEWFMGHRKAQAFVKLLGRGGTRILYCILGSAIAVIGLLITFGFISSAR